MIGKIRGIVSEINGNRALIETTSGLFYQVFITPAIIKDFAVGAKIELYTYLQVREDALLLFGFRSRDEHEIFNLLLSVPGVGPKTAFSVVSFSKVDELKKSVKTQDTSYLTQIPGLGNKTAAKIILELSSKLNESFRLDKMYLSEEDKTVVDALTSLGLKSHEAKNIFAQIPKDLSVENKIKEGLRLATRGKK